MMSLRLWIQHKHVSPCASSRFYEIGLPKIGGEGIEGDGVLNWMSSGLIGERPLVDGDVEEVGDLSLEEIEDEEVVTVDGVFEGAFWELGLEVEALVDAMEVMVIDDE
ncbi:hypothetical protein Tco_0606871 [Tanacetum coccineum]